MITELVNFEFTLRPHRTYHLSRSMLNVHGVPKHTWKFFLLSSLCMYSTMWLVSIPTACEGYKLHRFLSCLSYNMQASCIKMGLNKLVVFLREWQSPVFWILRRCTLTWVSGHGSLERLRSLLCSWEVIMQLVNFESTLWSQRPFYTKVLNVGRHIECQNICGNCICSQACACTAQCG